MAAPVREQLRDQRLELSKVIQQLGNAEKTNALATLDATITALQTLRTTINNASNVEQV